MATASLGASAPVIFQFDASPVRTIDRDGEVWFVAADVCKALSIVNPSRTIARLADDEKALLSVKGLSRGHDMANIVSESGLYRIVLTSRKPEAERFARWVTHDVLPAIRKTGQYTAAPAAASDTQPAAALIKHIQGSRFLTTVDGAGRITMQPVPADAYVFSLTELPAMLMAPDLWIDRSLLPDIIAAAARRLGSKA